MITFSAMNAFPVRRQPIFAGKPLEPEHPVDVAKLRQAEAGIRNALLVQGRLVDYTRRDNDGKLSVSAVVPEMQGYNILIEHMGDIPEAELAAILRKVPGLRPDPEKPNSYYIGRDGEAFKVAVVKTEYV